MSDKGDTTEIATEELRELHRRMEWLERIRAVAINCREAQRNIGASSLNDLALLGKHHGERMLDNLLAGRDKNDDGPERGEQPTVEDMDRRCIELLFYGDGERTFGAIRAKLIAEFGEELFNAAADRSR